MGGGGRREHRKYPYYSGVVGDLFYIGQSQGNMECVTRKNPYPHPLLFSFFHTADPFQLKVSFTLIFLNVPFFFSLNISPHHKP